MAQARHHHPKHFVDQRTHRLPRVFRQTPQRHIIFMVKRNTTPVFICWHNAPPHSITNHHGSWCTIVVHPKKNNPQRPRLRCPRPRHARTPNMTSHEGDNHSPRTLQGRPDRHHPRQHRATLAILGPRPQPPIIPRPSAKIDSTQRSRLRGIGGPQLRVYAQ